MNNLLYFYGLVTGVAISFVTVFIGICIAVHGKGKNKPDETKEE